MSSGWNGFNDEGPSAAAFSFKQPYVANGAPATIDRSRVKEITALNAERQSDLLAHVLTLKA